MARDPEVSGVKSKWAYATAPGSGVTDPRIDFQALYDAGWDASFSQQDGDAPAREHFNWLFRVLTGLIVEINERGVLEWDVDAAYKHPATVSKNSQLYLSKRDNTGVDPTLDTNHTDWVPFGVNSTTGTLLADEIRPLNASHIAMLFSAFDWGDNPNDTQNKLFRIATEAEMLDSSGLSHGLVNLARLKAALSNSNAIGLDIATERLVGDIAASRLAGDIALARYLVSLRDALQSETTDIDIEKTLIREAVIKLLGAAEGDVPVAAGRVEGQLANGNLPANLNLLPLSAARVVIEDGVPSLVNNSGATITASYSHYTKPTLLTFTQDVHLMGYANYESLFRLRPADSSTAAAVNHIPARYWSISGTNDFAAPNDIYYIIAFSVA